MNKNNCIFIENCQPKMADSDSHQEEDFSDVGLIISLGSYDKTLHVYKFLPLAEDSLDLCFSQKTHEGMIRACGVSGPYVATCSSDETVRIKNTRKDMEQIILTDHEGRIWEKII